MSSVDFEVIGKTAVVTLNRPDKLNAINKDLLEGLILALRKANDDDKVCVILLTGAGRAFCAGDDLSEFDSQSSSKESATEHVKMIQEVTKLTLGSRKPVVGAIHGYAVGGGFEWVANCDLVVAGSDLVCFFPEMSLGNFVTGGITFLLPKLVGYQKSMELLLLGERQDATKLKDLGIVNWVVDSADLIKVAKGVCEQLEEKSFESMARLKTVINSDLSEDLWAAVQLEQDITVERFLSEEAKERARGFKK